MDVLNALAKIGKNEDLAKRQVKKIYAFFQELNEVDQFRSVKSSKEKLKKLKIFLYYPPSEYEVAYDELCTLRLLNWPAHKSAGIF